MSRTFVFCRAKGRDPIVIEYLTKVRDNYRKIVEAFTFRLDQEIDLHLEAIFLSPTDRANFRTLEKHYAMFGSVRDAARFKVQDRRSLWVKSVEGASEKLDVQIQAKK